ncbi:MAG: amidohydrolase family protein [Planctomycetaceae bacterium]|nr:amidohydrolase family protein [Planctomycetaceae bacterium]
MLPAFLILSSVNCGGMHVQAAEPGKEPSGSRLYLDEFRPKAQLKVERVAPARARFACINMHTHPATLKDDEIRNLATNMDAANVAFSICLDGQAGLPTAELIQRLEELAPDRYVVFARMDAVGGGNKDEQSTWAIHDPDFGERMADKLTESVRLGAVGLKLLKDLGLVWRDREGRLIPPDDPRFDPVWERAGELGIPVLWHCADPLAFFQQTDAANERWEELFRRPEWSFYGQDFPTHQALIDAQLRVIARHPETTFICAHMGNLPEDLSQLGRHLSTYPNMHVETSARIAELGRQPYTARRFFVQYADRIMFGTDGPGTPDKLNPQFAFLETWDEYFPYVDDATRFPPQGFWNIYGIGLPDDVLRKVYFQNALRLIPGAQAKYERRAATLKTRK